MLLTDIDQALSELVKTPFEREQFCEQFLSAYGRAASEIKRLKSDKSLALSDLPGGILLPKQIHMLTCELGKTAEALVSLRNSKATQKHKVRLILTTDGENVQAENLHTQEQIECAYEFLGDHFLFFCSLSGISVNRAVENASIDIRATNRLNKLYMELLKHNPDWDSSDRRHAMNQFMARLIFCFFAEDTDIFPEQGMFSQALQLHTTKDGSNTHEVLAEQFSLMNTPASDRGTSGTGLPRQKFRSSATPPPYVNGGLFAEQIDIPRFSKLARSHLLEIGKLKWHEINPDIFGSMIQAIADDEERKQLGLHYTSVPNIHKVLGPLFLEDLHQALEQAKSTSQLSALLKRIARIRVFDPACGSGNFLVVAYKALRAIEAKIQARLGRPSFTTQIRLSNFRGVEIRGFPAEVARLSLIIAQYQCDRLYNDQRKFLPLDSENSIVCRNALEIDWLEIIPPTDETALKELNNQRLEARKPTLPLEKSNEGGETFVCGNPPFFGSRWQGSSQKADLEKLFKGRTSKWTSMDYVSGWFIQAADYCALNPDASAAFVATNSICQGQHVESLWPVIFSTGNHIAFAHTSFKWSNLASKNAGVTVVIVGLSTEHPGRNSKPRTIRTSEFHQGKESIRITETDYINGYLTPNRTPIVKKSSKPIFAQSEMKFGSMPIDGGHLLLSQDELENLELSKNEQQEFIRKFVGSAEFIRGINRYCLWLNNNKEPIEKISNQKIKDRIESVRQFREKSEREATRDLAKTPHRFGIPSQTGDEKSIIVVPGTSSENREYLPVGLVSGRTIISNSNFALYDAPLWNLALVASRLHLLWIDAICGKLETRRRYSNTLGWNTFPIPTLSDEDKARLTHCAEEILAAREAHFPATIAELYAPGKMPANLRAAHRCNDDVLEKIYNDGKRFDSDAERLETLFRMYAQRVNQQPEEAPSSRAKPKAGAKPTPHDHQESVEQRPSKPRSKPQTPMVQIPPGTTISPALLGKTRSRRNQHAR